MAAWKDREGPERAGHEGLDGGPQAAGRGARVARTVLLLHSSAGLYGADRQLLALTAGLDRERYRPLVVLPEGGELATRLEHVGVETMVRPLAVLRRSSITPAGVRGLAAGVRRDARELGRLALERSVDVVHSNTSVVLGGQAVASRARAAHVLHLREIYTEAGGLARFAWPAMRRRLLRADAVVCISAATAAQLGSSDRTLVVHDALTRDCEARPREVARRVLRLPPDRFVVALVGRVSDWKGHDVLARALADERLAGIAAIGLVAGDAYPGEESNEEALRATREKLGLGERLRLLGFRDDVATVFAASDAVAVPSTRPEPLGDVAIEAGAFGLPVVAANHGGLPEVVHEDETGRLVPPGDAGALAAALRALADDPHEAQRLGRAAAESVTRRFSRERLIERIQACYDRVLRRRPA